MRTPNDIDGALRALTREDAQVEVPAHLEAAIMRAWDAGVGATGSRGVARRPWKVL